MYYRVQVISWKPRAFVYHNFLSDDEAAHIIKTAAPQVTAALLAAGFRLCLSNKGLPSITCWIPETVCVHDLVCCSVTGPPTELYPFLMC